MPIPIAVKEGASDEAAQQMTANNPKEKEARP